jgi:hypothetical protein
VGSANTRLEIWREKCPEAQVVRAGYGEKSRDGARPSTERLKSAKMAIVPDTAVLTDLRR